MRKIFKAIDVYPQDDSHVVLCMDTEGDLLTVHFDSLWEANTLREVLDKLPFGKYTYVPEERVQEVFKEVRTDG